MKICRVIRNIFSSVPNFHIILCGFQFDSVASVSSFHKLFSSYSSTKLQHQNAPMYFRSIVVFEEVCKCLPLYRSLK